MAKRRSMRLRRATEKEAEKEEQVKELEKEQEKESEKLKEKESVKESVKESKGGNEGTEEEFEGGRVLRQRKRQSESKASESESIGKKRQKRRGSETLQSSAALEAKHKERSTHSDNNDSVTCAVTPIVTPTVTATDTDTCTHNNIDNVIDDVNGNVTDTPSLPSSHHGSHNESRDVGEEEEEEEEAPLSVDQEALDALHEATERELGERELLNIVATPPTPIRGRRGPKKAIFASDLVDMMFGKGDVRQPRKESVALVDTIVQEYIKDMMKSTAEDVTSQKTSSSMNETDLLFRVRHDKAKFERAVYLLKVSREVKKIKNAWKLQTSVSDDEDESLFN